MKLLIVRHGDPDYSIDSLTEKGWREAEYLSQRLSQLTIKEFYVSPLGRAKDTASLTLQKMGREAVEKEWLREFAPQINRPDVQEHRMIAWDWLPKDWMAEEKYFGHDTWMHTPIMQDSEVKSEYDWVTNGLDEILAEHGYIRQGHLYHVVNANNDTLVFFCHFGVECVLLSHLLHISPMVLWHGMCAAPSSVTSVVTEERREGFASFRMNGFGDISHLYAKAEPPAFAARFCECFINEEERHD
ncbi:MAG: histidine phosphatase family protein [Lachnospiraceae bacterium]|nr:histidine phosphatase family protein [Lachnospiraceae bacterium]